MAVARNWCYPGRNAALVFDKPCCDLPAIRCCRHTERQNSLNISKHAAVVLLLTALGACSTNPNPDDPVYDPHEEFNRRAHALNVPVDNAVYGPVSRTYGNIVPGMIRTGITNLKRNWENPNYIIHYSLQGKGELAGRSFMRFGVNTLFGFGGILDWGQDLGMEYRDTGFDETFLAYGVPEGGYLELPFGGPGTERDWAGWALDAATDPVYYVTTVAATRTLLVIAGLDLANDRYELDTVVDELYNNSTDSYAATRIAYLEAMRASYGGETELEALEDIYGDVYGDF